MAPAEMEAYMKQIMGVGEAVVVGDQQPYLTALITLDPEAVPELSDRLGISNGDLEKFVKEEKLQKYLTDEIESQCNAQVAHYQTIKKFEILPVVFSVETGELAPTMKIKRNIVHDKYKDQISSMYAERRTTVKLAIPPSFFTVVTPRPVLTESPQTQRGGLGRGDDELHQIRSRDRLGTAAMGTAGARRLPPPQASEKPLRWPPG